MDKKNIQSAIFSPSDVQIDPKLQIILPRPAPLNYWAWSHILLDILFDWLVWVSSPSFLWKLTLSQPSSDHNLKTRTLYFFFLPHWVWRSLLSLQNLHPTDKDKRSKEFRDCSTFNLLNNQISFSSISIKDKETWKLMEVEKHFSALGICLLITRCCSVKWFTFNGLFSCVGRKENEEK